MDLFDEIEVRVYDYPGMKTITIDVLCGTTSTRIRRLVSRLIGTDWVEIKSITWKHDHLKYIVEAW